MYVPDLERSDAGTFTCVSDNKIGNPDTASVTLAVACKSVCLTFCLHACLLEFLSKEEEI